MIDTYTTTTFFDGEAHFMGDGVIVLCQRDAERGPQNVVVTENDLRALLGQTGAP